MAKPLQPEPKFFMQEQAYERGLQYYRDNYFKPRHDVSTWGEKSTSYIESASAARRIHQMLPDAKIIAVLRNPIERAISNYWFSVKNGFETRPIIEALSPENTSLPAHDPTQVSVSPFAYLQRGRYMDYIDRYRAYFPDESIHLLIFEHMIQSSAVVQRVFRFLEVDADFLPADLEQVVNARAGQVGDDHGPPRQLREELADYFTPTNKRLEEYLGIALSDYGW